MPTTTPTYPVLDPTASIDPATAALRASQCALAIMAKAPRPGTVKTRLSPPLTLNQSAALNICFLQDTAQNLAAVCTTGDLNKEGVIPNKESVILSGAVRGTMRTAQSKDLPPDRSAMNIHPKAAGIISYTPAGDEHLFNDLLPSNFALIPQRGNTFGERLLYTAQDILACGYASVCLIDSDSPTVPTAAYERAVETLAAPDDGTARIVLGPSHDGGYYLIGLKHAHPEPFTNITWSTSTVAAETRDRCRAARLDLVELPLWYDVDDAVTLEILTAELLANTPPPFAIALGYPAPQTRAYLRRLQTRQSV